MPSILLHARILERSADAGVIIPTRHEASSSSYDLLEGSPVIETDFQ